MQRLDPKGIQLTLQPPMINASENFTDLCQCPDMMVLMAYEARQRNLQHEAPKKRKSGEQ